MSALAWLGRRAAAVWLATLTLVMLGVSALRSMPSAIYPEVEFPRIIVVARVGGAPPAVYQTLVTRPLEQTLATVLGVQRIRSKTIRGAAEISLQFAPETDMWRALTLVESKTNEARGELPPGTEVAVERITTGSFPVITFNLAGAADPRELRETAEWIVRPAIAGVEGVGRIEVLGGDVREVAVIIAPDRAASLGLTPDRVADKLRTAMSLDAVGRVERDRQLVTVVADAQPKTLDDIRHMPVATGPDGVSVQLGDVAEVVDAAEDRLVRAGGPRGETVVISVARLPGASATDVVANVRAVVKEVSSTLPAGVTLTPVYDQSELVRESMSSVRDAILIGILLCAVVIGLFLRDFRAGLVAGAAVPITLAITFGAMRVTGQTLNLMSLGGMAVAVGLVIDDAIVIIEAIARHRDEGMPALEAARRGTAELAPAVIGTTLTTVVVFAPLAFLGGIVGDFFRALAFTLSAAVIISLFVALVLVPIAAGWALSASSAKPSNDEGLTGRVTRRLASRPRLAAIALALLTVATLSAAPFLDRGFLPQMDEGAFVIDYFLPAGTALETSEAFGRAIESELRATPEIRTYSRRLGSELGPVAATQLDRGDIMVSLIAQSERKRSSEAVIADVRARIESKFPEVRIEFVQVLQDVLNDLAGNPRPVEVKVFGPDYGKAHEIAISIADKMRDTRGLVDLYDGMERESPELRLVVRRDEAARLGVTPDAVSAQLSSALLGSRVGAIRRYDRLVGVRVRYPNPTRYDPLKVAHMPVIVGGHVVSFDAVTNAVCSTTPSVLIHEALQPMVGVTADHEGRDIGSIADEIDRKVREVPVPAGYRVSLGGQAEAQRATLRQLAVTGLLGALLVLTVLATQFRRFRLALLVLTPVPLSIGGALVCLLATHTPLNASSLMGCVLLIGLVVKNGVLLLEEAERRLDEGDSPPDAVHHATLRRLRPVVMTTLATLAGLVPLALGIGAGAEVQRPLALAVIGGLSVATIATLGLLPPMALLVLPRVKS